VQTDPNSVLRLSVTGLTTYLRATGNPPFPVVRPIFCALLTLADCEGVGELSCASSGGASSRQGIKESATPIPWAEIRNTRFEVIRPLDPDTGAETAG
jgi:hypothetical protein